MKRLVFAGCGLLMIFITGNDKAMAQQSTYYANEAGIALAGYDVVSYHKQNEAMRGSKAHTATRSGSTFYFVDAANKTLFEENPEAYLPAFGGYCAFAMAAGNGKVPSNPETFKLRDGKLYLFFNDYYQGTPFNTIVPWNSDERSNLDKAKMNWKKLH